MIIVQENPLPAASVIRARKTDNATRRSRCLERGITLPWFLDVAFSRSVGAIPGCGLYAVGYRGVVIYVGKFMGKYRSDYRRGIYPTVGSLFLGDIVAARWCMHVGSLTARSAGLYASPSKLATLPPGGELFRLLKEAEKEVTDKSKNNCLGTLERLNFAHEHWGSFRDASPDGLLHDFAFVYATVDGSAVSGSASNIAKAIGHAESQAIRALKPRINCNFMGPGDDHPMSEVASHLVAFLVNQEHLLNDSGGKDREGTLRPDRDRRNILRESKVRPLDGESRLELVARLKEVAQEAVDRRPGQYQMTVTRIDRDAQIRRVEDGLIVAEFKINAAGDAITTWKRKHRIDLSYPTSSLARDSSRGLDCVGISLESFLDNPDA